MFLKLLAEVPEYKKSLQKVTGHSKVRTIILSQISSATKDACVAIKQLPAAVMERINKTYSLVWVSVHRREESSDFYFFVAGDKEVIQWVPRPATP